MEDNNLTPRMRIAMIVGSLLAIVLSILAMTGHGFHLLHRWHH
jgi:hypothetical protein